MHSFTHRIIAGELVDVAVEIPDLPGAVEHLRKHIGRRISLDFNLNGFVGAGLIASGKRKSHAAKQQDQSGDSHPNRNQFNL